MDQLSQDRLAKRKSEADAQLAKALSEITSKSPADVTEADAAFLRARRSYLSEEQLAVFADALRDVEPEEASEDGVGEKATAEGQPVPKKVKK
jgi:hypothetical protein